MCMDISIFLARDSARSRARAESQANSYPKGETGPLLLAEKRRMEAQQGVKQLEPEVPAEAEKEQPK